MKLMRQLFQRQKYLHIKYMGHSCIFLNRTLCTKRKLIYILRYTSYHIKIFEVYTSKNLDIYKPHDINIFIEVNSDPSINFEITEAVDSSEFAIFELNNFGDLICDDKIKYFDYNNEYLLLIKIKIKEKKKYLINYFSVTQKLTKYKISNEKTQYESSLAQILELKRFYKLKSNLIYKPNIYDINALDFSICNQGLDGCFQEILSSYTLKNNDRNDITINDSILKHNYYFTNIKNKEYDLEIEIKYLNDTFEDSKNYPKSFINCHFICKNYNHCSYVKYQNTHIFNLKCWCQNGYFGQNCDHEYKCGNCKKEYCNGNDECSRCKIGWEGKYCTVPECESIKMCGEHGMCSKKYGVRECNCKLGYKGPYCTRITCDNIEWCHNGGKCVIKYNKHDCNCTAGWKGNNCTTISCDGMKNCNNGGECILKNNTWGCKCSVGWDGKTCDIITCKNINSCGKHGYCQIEGNIRKCICHKGWTGELCNVQTCDDVLLCKNNLSINKNYKECSYKNNKRECICKEGITGYRCDKRICTEKENSKCGKNGECKINGLETYCQCKFGFKGILCDTFNCDMHNVCGEYGYCIENKDNFTCVCEKDWDGEKCNKIKCDFYTGCNIGSSCKVVNGERVFFKDLVFKNIKTKTKFIFPNILLIIVGYIFNIILIIQIIISVFYARRIFRRMPFKFAYVDNQENISVDLPDI